MDVEAAHGTGEHKAGDHLPVRLIGIVAGHIECRLKGRQVDELQRNAAELLHEIIRSSPRKEEAVSDDHTEADRIYDKDKDQIYGQRDENAEPDIPRLHAVQIIIIDQLDLIKAERRVREDNRK